MGGCARVASSTALKAITVTCAHAAAKDAFNAQIEEPGSKEETAQRKSPKDVSPLFAETPQRKSPMTNL